MASVSTQGKKFTIRYRNKGDKNARRYTMPEGSTKAEAEKKKTAIQADIDRLGSWTPGAAAGGARARGAAARSAGPKNLTELVEAHITGSTDLAESTLRLKRAVLRPFAAHAAGSDRRRSAAPITSLSIQLVRSYLDVVEKRTTKATATGYGRQVSAFWRWAHRNHKSLGVPTPNMPKLSSPGAPQVLAPTFDEIDRMIAQFLPRGEAVRRLMLIQRWQGLRVGQAAALQCVDFVPDWRGLGPALQVRTGKSARESAQQRWEPVAPDLAKRISSWTAGRPSSSLIVGKPPRDPADTVRGAWVRSGQESPKQPTHALRKRFISHMVEQGVSDAAIDYLVGHAPKGVRSRHYVDPRAFWPKLTEALATIPPLAKHERRSSRGRA